MILAGGRATRFDGAPKGLLRVGGVRIIDRVAAALRASCDNLLLIANDADAQQWLANATVRPDVYPGMAALGGIHAGLAHSGTDIVVVAWDMPFVPASLLRDLRQAGAGSDAVLPASGSRRGVEPLCAFYSQACLAPIEEALASGDRRSIAFHDDVRMRVLSYAEVSRHGDAEVIFMNVNTVEELQRANEVAALPGVSESGQ